MVVSPVGGHSHVEIQDWSDTRADSGHLRHSIRWNTYVIIMDPRESTKLRIEPDPTST